MRAITAVIVAAAISTGAALAELCSLKAPTYATAMQQFPQAKQALEVIQNQSIATWYTDRSDSFATTATELVSSCPEATTLNVVVYGLPNKDCEAGASTVGSRNTNDMEYAAFIRQLSAIVGDRKALYVLEPDAVGLIAKPGGCGVHAGYLPNLKMAVGVLSKNANADIYVDVGYWALANQQSRDLVVGVMWELKRAGHIKGIALNTANFRPTSQLAALCSEFQAAIGDVSLHCVVDTSRNFNSDTETSEWCNLKSAGVGVPPTDKTWYANVDHFLWLKPPGESDGRCDGRTADAMAGPAPGEFFLDAFKALWNQGYFVKSIGMPLIEDGVPVSPTMAPTPTPTASGSASSSSSSSSFSSSRDQDPRQDGDAVISPIDVNRTPRPTPAHSQPRPTPGSTTTVSLNDDGVGADATAFFFIFGSSRVRYAS